jgi:hypothetical protein
MNSQSTSVAPSPPVITSSSSAPLPSITQQRSRRSHHHRSSSPSIVNNSLPLGFSLFALSILACFQLQSYRKTRKIRRELERQIALRQEERIGRINIEKKVRKEGQEILLHNTVGYPLIPIGFIESPFPDRRGLYHSNASSSSRQCVCFFFGFFPLGTPRQPILAPSSRGFIRFSKKIIQFAHFEELSQFSHLWIVFLFHENTTNPLETAASSLSGGNGSSGGGGKTLAAKIAPPRLGGQRVGCLSTRSPHRYSACSFFPRCLLSWFISLSCLHLSEHFFSL